MTALKVAGVITVMWLVGCFFNQGFVLYPEHTVSIPIEDIPPSAITTGVLPRDISARIGATCRPPFLTRVLFEPSTTVHVDWTVNGRVVGWSRQSCRDGGVIDSDFEALP